MAQWFRSTPPRRGRPRRLARAGRFACFDPRPRAGGDALSARVDEVERVSIHAPAQGATWPPQPCTSPYLVSIHAPAQGATSWPHRSRVAIEVSIHAPAQGATADQPPRSPSSCFDPRPRAGGDWPCPADGHAARVLEFRSTPPRRGRPQSPIPLFGHLKTRTRARSLAELA